MKQILRTQRLVLSEFEHSDAMFIIELLNDPDFIRFIGDKNVRTENDAIAYLDNGPMKSYKENGFGLWKITKAEDSETPLGMCGLIKREQLPCWDIGYAFLPAFRAQGYAAEAALACKEFAFDHFGQSHLCGIVNQDNPGSINVLRKLGMRYETTLRLPNADHDVELYIVAKGTL